MIIYVVLEVWYPINDIRGCFQTIEKAEDYIKNTKKPSDNFKIQEWKLE